jgi:hypothetical protein
MVSGDSTSVSDNRLKSHTPDLDPKFIKELMRSLKTSYQIIGGKNLTFPVHFMKYIKTLGPVDAVEHYKYHTSKWISKFSLDVITPPHTYSENFWFFNRPNKVYMKRRLMKFRYAFQFWQAKRDVTAPLPEKVKELDYKSFKERLTQDLTVEYQFTENIRDKAKEYFKDYKVPSLRMGLTTKSCFEGHVMSDVLRSEYGIPTLKPYKTLRELAIHNLAAKWNYSLWEPHGTSIQLDEPMKIRTITKMAHTQMKYKEVQRTLLHYIQKKSPEFILTKEHNIWDHIKYLTKEPKHWYYCSGDYKAATDNLKRRVITSVVSQIPMDDEISRQFGTVLIDDFITTNGQLMGSILSFPILCVINKLVYECVQDMLPNQSSKPKINGDDILFKGTLEFIKLWYKYTEEAGFIPSKGKSLVDKNNFTINSRPYNASGEQKFANLKLTHVKGTIQEECDALKEFVRGAYGSELNEENIKKYLKYFPEFGTHKGFKIWRKYRSEYMPTEAGGLGLFPMNIAKLTNLQKMYTCYYLTTVKKQPLTQLQREVGVSPFIATEESIKEPIPRLRKYNFPRDFKLTKMSTPELEKLRYGMLSSRIHETEGVCAFHQ